ncbi:MAG: hypothetical protein LBH25_03680 [Fibromonadaceae bacterium]|jgi:hypothetical protein|nr:hypothetical protein [Fibromonadaceae bacterium]
MKKIFLCLMVITLFAIYSFSIDTPEQNLPSNFYSKEYTPDSLAVYIPDTIKRIMLRQDTMKVMTKAEIEIDTTFLYFDCVNLKIIKEENYFATLKNGKFEGLIDEEERTSKFTCRKKSPGATLCINISYFSHPYTRKIRQRPKPDIRKVKFGNRFVLYWDCANHEIMEDENFFSILQNKENIYSMASFITDKKVVCDNVRSKKDRIFKKGDIAYLFLSEYYNKLISSSECLGIQLERFIPGCEYNEGLLDYIEKNRNLVSQKVMSCLDSVQSAVRSEK